MSLGISIGHFEDASAVSPVKPPDHCHSRRLARQRPVAKPSSGGSGSGRSATGWTACRQRQAPGVRGTSLLHRGSIGCRRRRTSRACLGAGPYQTSCGGSLAGIMVRDAGRMQGPGLDDQLRSSDGDAAATGNAGGPPVPGEPGGLTESLATAPDPPSEEAAEPSQQPDCSGGGPEGGAGGARRRASSPNPRPTQRASIERAPWGRRNPVNTPVTEPAVAWRGGGRPARAVVNPGTGARVSRDPPAPDVVPPATFAGPISGSEAARASAEGLATLAAGMREGSLAVAGGSGYFWERLGLLQDSELGLGLGRRSEGKPGLGLRQAIHSLPEADQASAWQTCTLRANECEHRRLIQTLGYPHMGDSLTLLAEAPLEAAEVGRSSSPGAGKPGPGTGIGSGVGLAPARIAPEAGRSNSPGEGQPGRGARVGFGIGSASGRLSPDPAASRPVGGGAPDAPSLGPWQPSMRAVPSFTDVWLSESRT